MIHSDPNFYFSPDHDSELGPSFLLDATYMGLPADYLTGPKMQAAIAAALSQMADLEAGAIANPDEGRMVGHYWLRDPERAPKGLGPSIRQMQRAIDDFAAKVHSGELEGERGPLRNVVVVGIGGSALGPQLASFALSPSSMGTGEDRMRLFFLDNTDPDGFDRTLRQVARTPYGLDGTLVVVISKSGGTKETRNGQLEMKAAFTAAGLSFSRHAVAVTGEGSELHKTALSEGWLATFPMWDWVGGRTSQLSAVGLLPAALQGIDTAALLSGAKVMDEWTRQEGARDNPAMLLALCWHHAAQSGRRDMVILPYKDRLELFSRYLQQLVMESLGKERDLAGKVVHQGIAVYGNKGSTDQHAYVQQLRDGLDNFFATFIEVRRDRAAGQGHFFVEPEVTSGDYLLGFLLGTRQALREGGRPSLTLTVNECSPRTLGMLIALYERAVGFYASLCNINAYHQPGVEAGKRAAAAVLALQGKLLGLLGDAPKGAAELAAAAGGDAETAWRVLEHLAQNGRVRRIAQGPDPRNARFCR